VTRIRAKTDALLIAVCCVKTKVQKIDICLEEVSIGNAINSN
jgi:hypothetical protein